MFRNPYSDALVILVIVLLIFGPKRLPGLGKSLGTGIREFRDSITGHDKPDSDEQDSDERPQITQTAAQPGAPVSAESRTVEPAQTEHRG